MDKQDMASDIENSIFAIITHAGQARALLYEALDRARASKMRESRRCMVRAEQELKQAHDVQTDLIARDISGSLPISLLLVHAQDQLMTTMSEQSLIEGIIGVLQDIRMSGGK